MTADCEGDRLPDTEAGVFARLVAQAALGGLEPVTLLALLKHARFRLGAAAGGDYLLETSVRGVFAAGDVRSGSTKRCAAAVGEGSMAVQLVHARLAGQ